MTRLYFADDNPYNTYTAPKARAPSVTPGKTKTKTETYFTPGLKPKSTNPNDYIDQVIGQYVRKVPKYKEWGDGHIQDGFETVYVLSEKIHGDNHEIAYGTRNQAIKQYQKQIEDLVRAASEFNQRNTWTRKHTYSTPGKVDPGISQSVVDEANAAIQRQFASYEHQKKIQANETREGTRQYWGQGFDAQGKALTGGNTAGGGKYQGVSNNDVFGFNKNTTQLLAQEDKSEDQIYSRRQLLAR